MHDIGRGDDHLDSWRRGAGGVLPRQHLPGGLHGELRARPVALDRHGDELGLARLEAIGRADQLARLDPGLGLDALAREDARLGLDLKPSFDRGRRGAEAAGGLAGAERGGHGAAEKSDQLKVQRGGDEAGQRVHGGHAEINAKAWSPNVGLACQDWRGGVSLGNPWRSLFHAI